MAPVQEKRRRPVVAPRATPNQGLGPLELVGAGLSTAWVLGTVLYLLWASISEGGSRLGWVTTILMIVLPVVLIWVVVLTLRTLTTLRAEAARLQSTVDQLRNSYAQAQATMQNQLQPVTLHPVVERKLDEIAEATRQTGNALATFSSRRDGAPAEPTLERKPAKPAAAAAPRPEPEVEQPALALGTPAEPQRDPLEISDFIRAMQFPESPDDKEGFRALRLALEDRDIAKLVRAAQDVLTLLSQEGIYMDDLKPEMAHPEVWRRFAAGERGRSVAAVGGIRDRSSLALTSARMREDTIFRDAAHHFLRTFDRIFQNFEKSASDAELVALADTRTARAFMLFGRAAGVFD